MYYSDEILEEVRSRNDIVDVISSYVKLKRSGGTYFGLCPFHNEKTPSFSVTPRKQMFYCFGCHRGGSVITFVEMHENFSFQEAVKMLAARGGVQLPSEDEGTEGKRRQDLKAALLEIHKKAAAYYYYQLRSRAGETGMAYLRGRQLTDETMKKFGLGYAGKFSNGLYNYLKEQGYGDELLRQSGLVSADEKRGMYDRFWNRVMFPIMDINNRVIGFGGRVMGDGKPKYLNSPENEIFNKRRNLYGLNIARRSREGALILCEGYMDVISMHQAGFSNAVASLGTALTQEHCTILRRYTDQVILSYDSDNAGIDAAMRAVPMLREAGISAKILDLSPYKDPDEFMKAEGTQAFRDRLDHAQNSVMFEISVIRKQYDQKDPEERTRFQLAAAARIAQFELEAERENYIQAVANAYSISFEGLRQMVNRALAAGAPAPKPRPRDLSRPGRREEPIFTSQRLLLAWLTDYPGLYPILKQYLPPEDYDGPFYREAAKLLYEQMESGSVNEAAIADHFQEEKDQQNIADLLHTSVPVQSEEDLKKAVCETIRKVAKASMARQDESGEPKSLEQIQRMLERKRSLQELNGSMIDLGRAVNETDGTEGIN